MPAPGKLQGRTVAITGGARGIGRETAAAFVAAGATVALGDIDADLVATTAAELGVIGLPLDVTDAASFDKFLTEAEAELGPLDVLVNNAGIMPTGPFLEESDAITDRQIDINVRGVIIGSKLAGQRFTQRGGGHLVNIASLAGVTPGAGVATYCATKFAVLGLSESLQLEWELAGVRVTAICPAFARTELIAGLSPNWLVRQIGLINPQDVAGAIVDAVAAGRGGAVFVPRTAGWATQLLAPLPRPLQRRINHLLGADSVILAADHKARAAYLRRIAGDK